MKLHLDTENFGKYLFRYSVLYVDSCLVDLKSWRITVKEILSTPGGRFTLYSYEKLGISSKNIQMFRESGDTYQVVVQ